MKRMFKDWTVALILLAGVFVIASWLRSKPDVPDQAPGVALAAVDGGSFDLADHKGQTVVLNFWASWCPPCKAEIPEFSRFAKSHPDIAVVGLAVDSGGETQVAQAAKAFGISYPVIVADTETLSAYGINTLPTTVVIDGDGKVKHAFVGAMSYAQLEKAVK